MATYRELEAVTEVMEQAFVGSDPISLRELAKRILEAAEDVRSRELMWREPKMWPGSGE